LHALALPVRDCDELRVRDARDALRLAKPGQTSEVRPVRHVHDFDSIVAKCRNEELLSFRVQREMACLPRAEPMARTMVSGPWALGWIARKRSTATEMSARIDHPSFVGIIQSQANGIGLAAGAQGSSRRNDRGGTEAHAMAFADTRVGHPNESAMRRAPTMPKAMPITP
jgi:hypothetical protein